jgi:hypothetical protein
LLAFGVLVEHHLSQYGVLYRVGELAVHRSFPGFAVVAGGEFQKKQIYWVVEFHWWSLRGTGRSGLMNRPLPPGTAL